MPEETTEGGRCCAFCNEKPKYTCPRCQCAYCSLKCFQHTTHSECSEAFYKQQVVQELKEMKGDGVERDRMLQLLKKVQRDAVAEGGGVGSDVVGVGNIGDRLGDLDLDDADSVWAKLTDVERAQFQACVSKGDLQFVPVWKPWWTSKSRKIAEVSTTTKIKSNKGLPKIVKDLPKLCDVLRGGKSPDACVKYCVLEVLLAYCCVQREFNGDMYDSPTETVSRLTSLSKVLSEQQVYSDTASCVHCFINNVVAASDACCVDPVQDCLPDVQLILSSGLDSYLLRALSDLYTYLKKCSKHMKAEGNVELSRELVSVSRKVYFYLLYSAECGKEFAAIGVQVGDIRGQLLAERELMRKQKQLIEENYEKLKPSEPGVSENQLIQEL